ncbi:MAG TPA: mannose-6-phosphate isomerase [Streptosporangiaceae bacterium]|nr:mannose-6-phosphate isomerase [Streptosporangiaceae bacterium]
MPRSDRRSLAPLVLGPNQPAQFYRGGERIARFRGITLSSPYLPEDFVGSTTELFGRVGAGLTILDDGSTLLSAIDAEPVRYLGPDHVRRYGSDLALLVKLLDTGERLLVHFHPPRQFASAHLRSCHGKTEAWIVTQITQDAADESSGHVYVGFREDTDPGTVRKWVDAQDKAALLGALNKIRVAPGDTCLVPAGVPHAVGAGVTVVEVQEPTDFSILLEWAGYAIDGPAAGHLGLGYDLALEALDYSGWDRGRLAGLLRSRPEQPGRPGVVGLLPAAADDFFRVERVTPGAAPVDFPPEVAVLVVLEGSGALVWQTGSLPAERGMTLFVPYGAGPTRFDGEMSVLRCMPPAP